MTAAVPLAAAMVCSALAAAAALVLVGPDPGSVRLRRLELGRPAAGPQAARARAESALGGRGLAAVAAGAGVLVLVDGLHGLVLATVAGPLTYRLLGRLEPRSVVAERERMARDLPVAAHLLARAVAGGSSPVAAIEVVAVALGGPVAAHLRRIGALTRLGGDLATTWRSVPAENGLAPLARTVARAVESGAPLSDALDRLADDLRARRRFDIDRRARSVGVRAAAPLGLCFLPAFLLVGVVPVVVGVATTIFATVR